MAALCPKSSTPYRLVTARGRPGDFRVPVCTRGEPAEARDGVYHRQIDFNVTDELSWSKATTNCCDLDAPDSWCYHATSGQLLNAGCSEVCRAAGVQAALRLIDTWLILPVEYAYLKD